MRRAKVFRFSTCPVRAPCYYTGDMTKNSELKYRAPKARIPLPTKRGGKMADRRTKRLKTRAAKNAAARSGW